MKITINVDIPPNEVEMFMKQLIAESPKAAFGLLGDLFKRAKNGL